MAFNRLSLIKLLELVSILSYTYFNKSRTCAFLSEEKT